jgi:hypothetical protein
MARRSKSHPQRTPSEQLTVLLARHIPAFVVQRLRPMKDALRNNMQGLAAEQQQALRHALQELRLEHHATFQAWGEQFVTFLSQSPPDYIPQRLNSLPDPPQEPRGVWERLFKQAQQPDMLGVAASLLLYYLGCARALRQWKQQRSMRP